MLTSLVPCPVWSLYIYFYFFLDIYLLLFLTTKIPIHKRPCLIFTFTFDVDSYLLLFLTSKIPIYKSVSDFHFYYLPGHLPFTFLDMQVLIYNSVSDFHFFSFLQKSLPATFFLPWFSNYYLSLTWQHQRNKECHKSIHKWMKMVKNGWSVF